MSTKVVTCKQEMKINSANSFLFNCHFVKSNSRLFNTIVGPRTKCGCTTLLPETQICCWKTSPCKNRVLSFLNQIIYCMSAEWHAKRWPQQLNPLLFHSSSSSFINPAEGSTGGTLNIGEPAVQMARRQQGVLGVRVHSHAEDREVICSLLQHVLLWLQ